MNWLYVLCAVQTAAIAWLLDFVYHLGRQIVRLEEIAGGDDE